MIRKWIIPVLAIALMASAAPAAAAQSAAWHPQSGEAGDNMHHKGKMTRKDFEAYRLEKLKEIATYFGISTEGKTAEQLKKEVEAAKAANKDKWEAFKAQHQAKRLERLRKIADDHGIKTEGKTADQLRRELFELHGGKEKRKHRTDKEDADNKQQTNKKNEV
ncbi:hypothetical protein [Paenibacillus arenilitoris]|uniref:Uncharacterized protein n=1 Tax=Paenibacillus arenilitoris TaxID=2772299 RepID=A0A927H7W1_9BACL|nr:hypothetical protein [Paenibacillus arenilitoris]MBD2870947.1 hypothetical protein [Paenibacillus arenilitoris]